MRTKAAGESALLLLDAIQILHRADVDYAIVGALAASVHGLIRATSDADALLSISTSTLVALELSLKAAGFKTELRRGDVGDPISAVLTLRDEFKNSVDFLVGIRGFDPKAFSRTIEVALDGESLKFVGLEDFVAMKLFAGGPQDLVDAKGALEAAPEPPNMELLKELAKRYGGETVRSLESLLSNFSRDIDSGLELG
jgi:predicted nucleotidyltransferase